MKTATPGFRRALGYSVLGVLAIYMVLGLWLSLSRSAVVINKKITRYYRRTVLPGPFFREDRIHTPGHFYISYKKAGGDWTAYRNPETEHVQQYRDSFFDYNSLKQGRLVHYMARTLNGVWRKNPGEIVRSAALKRMHTHLRKAYIPADADSVKMLYRRGSWGRGEPHHPDTLFLFTYKSF